MDGAVDDDSGLDTLACASVDMYSGDGVSWSDLPDVAISAFAEY